MKKQRQFTLIEILATIAIITILVGIIVGVRGVADRKALEANTKSIMKTVELALEQHREDYGYYPQRTAAVSFNFSFTNPDGVNYLSPEMYNGTEVQDGYGTALRYQCPGTHNQQSYDLWSRGNDGEDGTADEQVDDITNWSR
jgi:general secretion pathway protein G